MGKIEVKLFGSPAVVLSDDASRPIPLSIQPLLAYLVVEPDVRRHRDRAIDALWPDVEPNKSRHRLNTAVWRLRRVLDRSGSSVVDCGRSGRIGLSDDVVVDARQLVDLLEIGSTSDRTTGDDWRGFVD